MSKNDYSPGGQGTGRRGSGSVLEPLASVLEEKEVISGEEVKAIVVTGVPAAVDAG